MDKMSFMGPKNAKQNQNDTRQKAISVTELVRRITRTLEMELPESLTVQGEVSNFKPHSSGHWYFVLKDDTASINAVMWRSDAGRVRFRVEDGLAVTAFGKVGVYEPRGAIQFYVRRVEPAGTGALELAFRQLCERLKAEGLFAAEHKNPLPQFPRRIAMVTSPTGAAVQDLIHTLRRRFPPIRLVLYPVKAQGVGAAEEIASAIQTLNRSAERLGGIDLMIVGRGGGSLEDLWAFNEEVVARAIYHSTIPVISAVGHETDVTVSDLVADARAATPTAAGEQAVPLWSEVSGRLETTSLRLRRQLQARMALADSQLAQLLARSPLRAPLTRIRQCEQRLDEQVLRLPAGLRRWLSRAGNRVQTTSEALGRIMTVFRRRNHDLLDARFRHLQALDPRQVVKRGYSITRIRKSGRILTAASQVRSGQALTTQLADGSKVDSEALEPGQGTLFAP